MTTTAQPEVAKNVTIEQLQGIAHSVLSGAEKGCWWKATRKKGDKIVTVTFDQAFRVSTLGETITFPPGAEASVLVEAEGGVVMTATSPDGKSMIVRRRGSGSSPVDISRK